MAPEPPSIWAVMPVMAHRAYTEAAISDVLAQTRPCHLLVINQGVDTAFRRRLEAIAEDSDRVFLWSHQPPLPSLAATWNRALDFAWSTGAHAAWVLNNDVRLPPNALDQLDGVMGHCGALVVTGVGVGPKQFVAGQQVLPVMLTPPNDEGWGTPVDRGGPDFSCFLVHRECHARWQFDERFVPAFCEDVDYHRQLLLAGEGSRIYSINVPYLHYGSTTLKSADETARARIERQVTLGARAYYAQKWGGPVNEERYENPFDASSATDTATTPQLQSRGSAA